MEEKVSTARARADGFYLMLIGAVIFLALSLILSRTGKTPMHDFRTAYYSGLSLVVHRDPYNVSDVEKLYAKESPPPATPDRDRMVVTTNIYFPSAFPFTVALALAPENLSLTIWALGIMGSFLLSVFLIWKVCADGAPVVIGFLLGFCLANSGSLVYFSNPAGFVVSFAILAALSFAYDKFVPAGIACLAISLAFKPHDSGLVWLYFFLAGGLYRKRALQTLMVIATFSLPALWWVIHISPHWLQEFSANLAAYSGPGAINDPRGPHGACLMTNLQTVTSFFWQDQKTYNLISYVVCAPLLLWWVYLAFRARASRKATWLALAPISALSVLPVYHRQYDAKLILLALPAFVLLWSRSERFRWPALVVTATAFFLNGDFPWVVLLRTVDHLHLATGPYWQATTALLDFPVPLSLLAMGVFYLWVFDRSVRGPQYLRQEAANAETIAGS